MCYYGQYFMYGNDLFVFPFFKKTHFQKIVLQGYSIPSYSSFMFICKKNEKIGNDCDS